MADRVLSARIECPALGQVDVFSGTVTEGLSTLTSGSVLVSADAQIELGAAAIGKPAKLTLDFGGTVRHFHLLVTAVRFEHLRSGKYHYTLDLCHELVRLTLRSDVRMFQNMTAKDVVAAVLEGAGIASDHVTWKLTRDPAKRTYCVQYRETDLAFASRLLEFEGIFFLIEHDDSHATIRFADAKDAFTPIDGELTVPFVDENEHGLGVHDFEVESVWTSDAVQLNDYNFEQPHVDMKARMTLADKVSGEVYEYPAGYDAPAAGATLVKIRGEEILSRQVLGRGRCDFLTWMPGRKFELSNVSRDGLAKTYVIRELRHSFVALALEREDGARPYVNAFVCAPEASPYRPPRATPRAWVRGSHNVVVTGPAGEEIHTEKFGRMKAKFYWDRVGKDDDTSSCWMRVSQIPIGGSMTLARMKWEMAVRYVHGDPDRPIVVARIDNGGHPSPYAYPGAQTAMSLKTPSSPGGGKHNELKLEDGAGGMQFFANASKDWDETIKNDKSETIAVNEKLDVGVDSATTIGVNQTVKIGAVLSTKVGSDAGLSVLGDRTKTVGAAETCTISGNVSEKVQSSDTELVGAARMTAATMGVFKKCKGSQSLLVGGATINVAALGVSCAVAGARADTIGGARIAAAGMGVSESVIGALALTVGGAIVNNAGASCSGSSTTATEMTVGGAVLLNAGGKVSIKAKKIGITVGGVANLLGGGGIVNLTPGSLSFVGLVMLKASGGIKIAGNPNLVG